MFQTMFGSNLNYKKSYGTDFAFHNANDDQEKVQRVQNEMSQQFLFYMPFNHHSINSFYSSYKGQIIAICRCTGDGTYFG